MSLARGCFRAPLLYVQRRQENITDHGWPLDQTGQAIPKTVSGILLKTTNLNDGI